jgi:uncharacterized membrane protein
LKPASLFSRLFAALWFVPLMCVLAGVALSLGTIFIDRKYDYQLVPTYLSGGPDAALEILGTVAASMVSLAALVLTITMVVVQLAMGQFSPRIVQRILQDKPSQLAIGVFVGTFAHALLTLREIQTGEDGVVPGLAVIVAFVLVLTSIVVLVWYVNHLGGALRVSALIELVGADTRALLDEVYPKTANAIRDDARTICAPRSGVITSIDYATLVETAERDDCLLELRPALGEFVAANAPLFNIKGGNGRLDREAALRAITLELERTLDQDVAYGLRLLVDIAERSLSDGPFLDPTTAVQAIDRLHDCLHQLVSRDFPDGRYCDDTGKLRLVTPAMTWADYVQLAFDEIRLAGAGSPQIARRLRAALEDLLAEAPRERKDPLRKQLRLLESCTQDALSEPTDRRRSNRADASGMG